MADITEDVRTSSCWKERRQGRQAGAHMIYRSQHDARFVLVFKLLVCLGLFVFGHSLRYSVDAVALEHDINPHVADLVEKGDVSRQVALLALAAISAIVLFSTSSAERCLSILSRNPAYVALVMVAGASIIWADDPGLAMRRAGEFLLISLIAFTLAQLCSLDDLLHLSCLTSCAYICCGALAEVALGTLHPLAEDYRFAGTLHPNHQAWQCGLLVLSASVIALRKRDRTAILYWLFASAGMVFLLLTKSRTTLGAVIVSLLLYVQIAVAPQMRRRVLSAAALLSTVLVSVCLVWPSVLARLYQSQLAGRGDNSVENLTGRIPLWSLAIGFILKRPLLGYGFYSFWSRSHIAYFSQRLGWDVPESHNGYIELLLGVGVTGLAMYLLMLGVTIRRLATLVIRQGRLAAAFPLVLLLFFMIIMMCDTIALDINIVTTVIFAFAWKAGELVSASTGLQINKGHYAAITYARSLS